MSSLKTRDQLGFFARKIGLTLALAGMFLQVGFSIAHSSAISAHLLGEQQGANGVIVLCTPGGLKSVRVGSSFDVDHQDPAPTAPEETCPTCSTIVGNALLSPTVAKLAVPSVNGVCLQCGTGAELFTIAHFAVFLGRAPPV